MNRLPHPRPVDRPLEAVTFSFEGAVEGYAGDTIASALSANGLDHFALASNITGRAAC